MTTRRHKGARGARLYYPNSHRVAYVLNDDGEEPPNPSPDVLPSSLRNFWDGVEQQAENIYVDDQFEIAEKSAWRAVRMNFVEQEGQWRNYPVDPPLPLVLPDVGDCVVLGKLLEYAYITTEARIVHRKFDDGTPPDLLWNPEQQTLYAFPTTTFPEVCNVIERDMQDTAHVFKRWSQRDADCQRIVAVPMARLRPVGAGDTIVYRSDKWHDKNWERGLPGSQEYIHIFGDDVWVWEDNVRHPNAVMIRGGRLDVEERGIIH